MNKTRALYKAFSSNLEMPRPNGEKKIRLYNRFGMIAFIGIMLPIAVVVGYITYVLTDLLYLFDGNAYGLLSELDLISAFAMIFGMPLMFSVLYFSSDLQFITALPVKPESLFAARFWHTFKAENVMTSNVLFAIYIGYYVAAAKNSGLKDALHPVSLLSSVIGLYSSLLLPLIYCSIIAMLLMLVLRNFKRSDIYYHSSLILFTAFAVMFLLSFKSYGAISMMNYIDSLVLSNNTFTAICNVLFPTNYLTTLSLRTHRILPLIGSAAITAALYMLTVLTARFTYRKGLFAAFVMSGRKKSKKITSEYRSRKILNSLILKEIKVLTRTMTYRMNCVYANLLWPLAALLFIIEAPRFEFAREFTYKLQAGDAKSGVILFSVFIASAFIASGLNSIASTSFTREGVHLDMLRFLPADPGKQILAKVFVAVLFTAVPELIAVVMVTVFFGAYTMLPLYIFISLVCILIATLIGILMDSISPYTVWSDELSALRGNLNCFFNLAAEMVFALLTGIAGYGIYLLSGSFPVTVASVAIILTAVCAMMIIKGLPRVRKNIELLK